MTVYVCVVDIPYEANMIVGVYTSLPKARKHDFKGYPRERRIEKWTITNGVGKCVDEDFHPKKAT